MVPEIFVDYLPNNVFTITVSTEADLEYESKVCLFEIYDYSTSTYLYQKTDMSTVRDTYTGIATEGMVLQIRTQGVNKNGVASDILSSTIEINYDPSVGVPDEFTCTLEEETLHWNIKVPSGTPIYGYRIDYKCSDSLNLYNVEWDYLYDDTLYISEDATDRDISYSFDIGSALVKGSYVLVRVNFYRDSNASKYTSYGYATLPRYSPYTTYVVTADGVTPCITRSNASGQWRQCRINYYELQPLLYQRSEEDTIAGNILNVNELPIYRAKKET